MKKKGYEVIVPGGAHEVLLHTCCAPCSSAIIECMLQHDIRPTIYYCNPNIYPLEEYNIRKNECTRYAQSLGLDIVDADYDHGAWLACVKGLEQEPERGGRCLKCFKMRLRDTARYASEHGFSVITTTLGAQSVLMTVWYMLAGLYITPKGFTVALNISCTKRLPILSAKHEPTNSISSCGSILNEGAGMSTMVRNSMCAMS